MSKEQTTKRRHPLADQIQDLYNQGFGIKAIARQLEIGATTARRSLRTSGVQIRGAEESKAFARAKGRTIGNMLTPEQKTEQEAAIRIDKWVKSAVRKARERWNFGRAAEMRIRLESIKASAKHREKMDTLTEEQREVLRAKWRESYQRTRLKRFEDKRIRQHENPEKPRAHAAVYRAIKRGELRPVTEMTCNRCDKAASNYHHWSYREEHWLDVEPLCKSCHIYEHSHLPQRSK